MHIRRDFDDDFLTAWIVEDSYRNRLFVSNTSEYIRLESNIVAGPPETPFLINPYKIGITFPIDVQLNLTLSDFEQFFVDINPYRNESFNHGMSAMFASTIYHNMGQDPSKPGAKGTGSHSYSMGLVLSDPIPSSIRLMKSPASLDSAYFRHFEIGSYDFNGERDQSFDWAGNFHMQPDGQLACFDVPKFRSFAHNYILNFFANPGDTLMFSRINDILIPVFWVNPAFGTDCTLLSIDDKHNRGWSNFHGVIGQSGFYSEYSTDKMYWCTVLDNGVLSTPITFAESPNPITYYPVKENSLYRLLGHTAFYELSGQQGLTWFDFSGGWSTGIPCVDLFQVQVNGQPTQFVKKGQNGLIRFIPWDWSNDITNVTLALSPPSGETVLLSTEKINREYRAAIPDMLSSAYIDVLALVEDAKGRRMQVRMMPGFYFGEKSQRILHGRLFVDSYFLQNPESSVAIGDTLKFSLKLKTYGNKDLQDVSIIFPEHSHVLKLGESQYFINTLTTADSAILEPKFLLTALAEKKQISYPMQMHWHSNGIEFKSTFDLYIPTCIQTKVVKNRAADEFTFHLSSNYPNPFNQETVISFSIPETGQVVVDIFNIQGQRIDTLIDEILQAGEHLFKWEGLDEFDHPVSSGVYLYRIRFAKEQHFGKMVMQR